MSRSLLLIAALVAAPTLASAGPSKAWTAAKKVHPEAPILAGVDVASAKSSEAFKKFYPLLLQKKPEAKDILERLQKECAFDPFVAINSVVAVIDDSSGDNKGGFYIALNGWDAAKVGACAQKIAKTEKKEIKVGKVVKGVQELEMVGKTDRMYLGWIGKNVLVVATDPMIKSSVEAMLAGKGAGETNKLANKIDTGATVWMAVIKKQTVQPGIDMNAVYGTVKLANGQMSADARVLTGGKDQATKLAGMFNTELPKMAGSLPPAAQSLVKAMKMTANDAEIQATTSAPEKDLIDLLTMLQALM